VRDENSRVATSLDGGRGLVACLEPVRLVSSCLFEAVGATLGCGRPRTRLVAAGAAGGGPRWSGDSLRVASGTRFRRLRFCLEIASLLPQASCPEPIAVGLRSRDA